MSNQIQNEYERTLTNYRDELLMGKDFIDRELVTVNEALRERRRFYVRHSMMALAETIIKTDHKLLVFGNLVWGGNDE